MKIIFCKNKNDFDKIVNIEYESNKKMYNYKSKMQVKNMLEEYFKKLNCKKIKLSVLYKNTKAIRFYKQYKFNVVKKYKKGKALKLVMAKKI